MHATGEHRWILRDATNGHAPAESLIRTTNELRPGDKLKTLRNSGINKEQVSPFGVAHGFVYGDGTKPHGARGTTVTIYDNGKDAALLPYFALNAASVKANGARVITGLPRAWKTTPDLTEHRGYLLGWLAGYFAADGSVTKAGQAVLYSTSEESIRAARDVCAVLGISHSPIRSRKRNVTLSGREYSSILFSLCIDTRTVPAEFFLIPEHRIRAVGTPTDERTRAWTVESVVDTDRVETVYCATVPGAGAFALADELMTGNCPFQAGPEAALMFRRWTEDPDRAVEALLLEATALALNPRSTLFGTRASARQRSAGQDLPAARLAEQQLTDAPWARYEVRRIKGPSRSNPDAITADRSVRTAATGDRDEMEQGITALAGEQRLRLEVDEYGYVRAWARERGSAYPLVEHFWVAAPAGVADKQPAGFEDRWADATGAPRPLPQAGQLALPMAITAGPTLPLG